MPVGSPNDPSSGRGRMSGSMGGRMGKRLGKGPGGSCICPACGTRMPHQPGVPCSSLECPKCGTKMVREA